MSATRTDRLETLAFAVVVLGALLACNVNAGGNVKAQVNCEGSKTAPTIDCDVKHVEGTKPAHVCWDLRFGCANGVEVTGQGFCQDVDPSATAQQRIPLTRLTNADQCDQALSAEVRNIKITVR